MSTRNVVLCAPVRTAIGTYGGALKDTPASELGEDEKRSGADRLSYLVWDDRVTARRGNRADFSAHATRDDVPSADGQKMWAHLRHVSPAGPALFDADLDRGRRTSLSGTLNQLTWKMVA